MNISKRFERFKISNTKISNVTVFYGYYCISIISMHIIDQYRYTQEEQESIVDLT